MREDDGATVGHILERLVLDPAIDGVQLFDASGGVVYATGRGLQIKVNPR